MECIEEVQIFTLSLRKFVNNQHFHSCDFYVQWRRLHLDGDNLLLIKKIAVQLQIETNVNRDEALAVVLLS